ncbi:hypothetical protein [Gemmatimonas groenlandica]|uniref:Uncharacterized protein n=1 Tax=Gemmatimonas groenlandica TaxID=2732249 RepID=A0A6M4IR76_9BACT|nr:hypothetical protein [Gemmatimonas groenlandica]QJR34741.1 hypothetical protein HKW67_04030 [Gemmatimonas groenlandica]
MIPITDVAVGFLMAWQTAVTPGPLALPLPSDSLHQPRAAVVMQPVGLTMASADTVPRVRRKAVAYSDGYATRLRIHKILSWGMIPLFAASYFSGDQLLEKGTDAPSWARNMHAPAATGSAILFGANTVTGGWNLWEGRKDPNGRTRRIIHSVLFTAASGGFAYAGTKLADDAEQDLDARRKHRNVALGSMGVSTVSWLIMLIGN